MLSTQEYVGKNVINHIQVNEPEAQELAATKLGIGQSDWLINPQLAYRQWRESARIVGERCQREFAPHSVEQYESMFKNYLLWLAEKGVSLTHATPEHLDLFLSSKKGRDGKPAASTTRRRYLNLLNNVYEHLRLMELTKANPVAPLIDLTRHQEFDKPAPTILPFELSARYIEWVSAQPQENWYDLRNKVIRLIFIASGITVQELQRLRPEQCLTDNGFTALEVEKHNLVPAHLAPVSSYAADVLLQWKRKLLELSPQSPFLFATRAHGYALPQKDCISSVEVFLLIREAMEAIGYDRHRQGPQTLRNTFIARQIWDGKPVDRIMSWCGLRTSETVQNISRLVPVRRGDPLPG